MNRTPTDNSPSLFHAIADAILFVIVSGIYLSALIVVGELVKEAIK